MPTTTGSAERRTPPKITGGIISPSRGAGVAADLTTLSGTATIPDDDDDHEVWLLVEVMDAARFYPGIGALDVDSEGKWSQRLYIGGADDEPGSRYRLHLMIAPSKAARSLRSYRMREAAGGDIVGMTKGEVAALGLSDLAVVGVQRES